MFWWESSGKFEHSEVVSCSFWQEFSSPSRSDCLFAKSLSCQAVGMLRGRFSTVPICIVKMNEKEVVFSRWLTSSIYSALVYMFLLSLTDKIGAKDLNVMPLPAIQKWREWTGFFQPIPSRESEIPAALANIAFPPSSSFSPNFGLLNVFSHSDLPRTFTYVYRHLSRWFRWILPLPSKHCEHRRTFPGIQKWNSACRQLGFVYNNLLFF